MSFLTPLYFIGIVAIGLPILLHLVRHQPKNTFLFSSLRFLEHKPPQTNRKNNIENWLLLLIRTAVVLLLVAAFARPFFINRDLELTHTVTKQKTIILIDASSSMRRETLWNRAIQKANELIQQSVKNQIAIYTFDSQLKTIKALQEINQQDLPHTFKNETELLTELSPGWSATNLGHALREIAALLQQEAASDPTGTLLQNCTIELITDFQAGSQITALSKFAWPKTLQIQLHQLETKQISNAGLQLLSMDEKRRATVRIVNAADSEREHFTVTSQDKSKKFKQPQSIYVPRGQSRVVRLPALDSQQVSQITLSGDDHEFDNRLYIQPRAKTNLTVVHYGFPAAGSIETTDYFAKRAFPTTENRDIEFLTIGPDSPQILLADSQIHLLIVSRILSIDEIKLVQRYLQQGGVVLYSLHDPSSVDTLNPILGNQHKLSQKAIVNPVEINDYALLTDIQYDHPVFKMFQSPEFSDFTKLKFWNYQQLALTEEVPHQVLARFDHQNPAIVNIPMGKGKLIVMTFGWTPEESQFALSTKFVPILNSILAQNENLIRVPSQFTVGEKIQFPESIKGIKISPLMEPEIQLTAGQQSFRDNIQPGVYQVTSENKHVTAQKFAVNLAIDESNTSPLAIEKLESLGINIQIPGDAKANNSSADEIQRQALVSEWEQKQKIWRWLIIGALAMLCLETLLGKWNTKAKSARRKV